jgi:DnaJ family protein B protein 4
MDGHLFDDERTIEFPVKPGWKAGLYLYTMHTGLLIYIKGTKLTYPGEGDEEGMKLTSDAIFIIREKEHQNFTREGNDLIFTINLDLPYALQTNQIQVTIPLIEGGIYSYMATKLDNLTSCSVVMGRGMPISKSPGTRGDLIIRLNILLPPKTLNQDKIKQISAILG